MSVLPLTSHAGARIAGCSSVNQTICLRPPIRQDPRAGQTFRCKDPASISRVERNTDDQSCDKALAEAWKCCKNPTISEVSGTSFMNECPRHGASGCESASCWWTSGGCDCSGRKWLSLTASSVFVTGMDETRAEAKAKMKIFDACRCFDSDLNVTSFMDALVDSAWLNNHLDQSLSSSLENHLDQSLSSSLENTNRLTWVLVALPVSLAYPDELAHADKSHR